MFDVLLIILICSGIAAVLSIALWYAFWYEPANFVLSEVDINICQREYRDGEAIPQARLQDNIDADKLKKPFFTILHLSDFHLRKDRIGRRLAVFIKSLKNIHPDLVFITGDLVEKNAYFGILSDMLSGLNARLGSFAVLGVHDYYNKSLIEFTRNMIVKKKTYSKENDVTELIRKLNGNGIRVLKNESVSMKLDETNNPVVLQITGIEDAIIQRADLKKAFNMEPPADDQINKDDINVQKGASLKKMAKTGIAGIKDVFKLSGKNEHILNSNEKIIICLTHTPDQDLIAGLAEKGIDILICGHTHGGQVRLPGVGAIISGCNIKSRYAAGLFYFKKFVLFVSRGLGTGRYSKFRFYCQPEAVLIKINKLYI